MQFVPNGPEIPEALLEAHEEGRVVFFCGAGISNPAKLPTFYGLVEQVYNILNVDKSNAESEALKTYKYDTALGLLEQRLPNGRAQVREAIAQSLIHDLTAKKATQTHEALLTLSKNRNGATRLITTNFDRVFEEVIASKKTLTKTFSAPLLPVPKNRWDGLIYLHGLLDDTNSEENLNSLVATSGDFGLAYLVERWAARFVSELFRNYTVCFVGYSINDPILRYMMDALAADSMMGEKTPVAYAFGNTKKGKKKPTASEWAAKNVVPILYRNHSHHYYLHETLHAWANSYRDGVNGKQAIVTRYAHTKPTGTTKQDDFVRRMVWAISDETGLPAKRFAETSPSPSIEWLPVFADNRFGIEELSRFGVSRNEKKFVDSGDPLKFSLLSRPSPSSLAKRMSLAGMDGQAESKWDMVMEELAKWLANHMAQPEAIFWVIGQGGNLHPRFKFYLEEFLKKDGDSLSDPMKKLWVFVLSGYAKLRHYNGGLYSWKERFSKYGNTPIVRLELKAALRPSLRISRPYSSKFGSTDSTCQRISDIANIEITLASDHVHSAYATIKEIEGFNEFVPHILTDMTELLCETLDLMCEAEKSSELDDYSYIERPSISDHDQNNDYNDWTLLVTLCRDAWVATSNTDPDTAIAILTLWARSKYPVFRRLVFFALAQKPDLVPVETSITWILSDDGHWIWSTSTMRETMRLLVSIGPLLSKNEGPNLQRAIIDGPPRSRFSDNTSEEEFQRLADRMRWLRLKKLLSGGASATEETVEVIEELEQANPDWDLAPDERDEFPTWSSNGEDIVIQQSPKNIKELILWLRDNPTSDDIRSPDNWSERCRDDFRRSISALLKLAKDGEWLSQRWGQALHAWSNEGLIGRSWECAAPVVAVMPVKQFTEALHAITFWVSQNSSNIHVHQEPFFSLIDRIIELGAREEYFQDNGSINHAINHPIGRAANSLLNWWFSTKLEDGQGLPVEISNRFNQMCTSDNSNLWLGTVVLAQQIIPLFRGDPAWTKQNLLTDFSWGDDDTKTATMWDSFLHNPRIYPPLLRELKEPFLSVSDHIHELSDVCAAQYARYLTYIALNEASVFSDSELKSTFSNLTPERLETVVQTLFNATAGAGDQKTEYIKNRVLPFVKKFWPNAEDARTEKASLYFAQICAISEATFITVFKELEKHLRTVSDFSYLLHLLKESQLAENFPALVLRLLDLTIPDEVLYLGGDLGGLLTRILQRAPELEVNRGFIRLNILSQQHRE